MSREAVDKMTARLVKHGNKPEEARRVAIAAAKKHDRKNGRSVISVNTQKRK